MKISDMFPRKYATGEDLQGKALMLTIAAVKAEKMTPQPGSPPVDKYVIYFQEAKKGIVLNRTLAQQIASIHGPETDDWTGKRITIYPVPMTVAGKHRIAIRARAAQDGEKTPPPSMQEENEEETDD
jgi:hypothetical protein